MTEECHQVMTIKKPSNAKKHAPAVFPESQPLDVPLCSMTAGVCVHQKGSLMCSEEESRGIQTAETSEGLVTDVSWPRDSVAVSGALHPPSCPGQLRVALTQGTTVSVGQAEGRRELLFQGLPPSVRDIFCFVPEAELGTRP